jgi:hypothetical protein
MHSPIEAKETASTGALRSKCPLDHAPLPGRKGAAGSVDTLGRNA